LVKAREQEGRGNTERRGRKDEIGTKTRDAKILAWPSKHIALAR